MRLARRLGIRDLGKREEWLRMDGMLARDDFLSFVIYRHNDVVSGISLLILMFLEQEPINRGLLTCDFILNIGIHMRFSSRSRSFHLISSGNICTAQPTHRLAL